MDMFSTTSALLLLLLLLLPGVVSLSPPHLLFLLSLYSNSCVFLRVPLRPQRLGFRHGPSHPFTPSHPISSDNCFFCLQNGSRQIPYMSVLHYSLHFLFLLPLLPRSSPLWGDELVGTVGAITNERKSDTAWTFPPVCIRIPEIFPLFSFLLACAYCTYVCPQCTATCVHSQCVQAQPRTACLCSCTHSL